MRRYETIFISNPDIPGNQREDLFERVKSLISKHDGFLAEFDEWGTKKLAYEIKKKGMGHYVRLDYCGPATLVTEMERSFRIDDSVLKYMTILLDPTVDLDALKEEVAQKESSKETAAQETNAAEAASSPASPEEPSATETSDADEKTEPVEGEE